MPRTAGVTFTAGMCLSLRMMSTARRRIICQAAPQIPLYRVLHSAADTAVQLNTSRRQGASGSPANAAADQHLYTLPDKETSQSAVPLSIGIHDLSGGHRAVFHLIQAELLGVSKVLIYISIFIGHCNFHHSGSFQSCFLPPAL